MTRSLVFVLFSALCGTAMAAPIKMFKESRKATSLSATAINATAYTGWIRTNIFKSIALEINYTYSAATAVTMSCETSDDGSLANGAGFDIHVIESPVGGTMTTRPAVWSNPVAASEKWTWTIDNLPQDYINCWFDGTSADGSDTVTVVARRITP